MSLKKILEEIETNRATAEMNAELGPENTRVGRMGIKRNAVELTKRLKLQYRKELMGSVAFIVVTGTARDQFAQAASDDKFGCFSVDPDSMFAEIASKIDARLYGRESTKHLFNIVTNLLQDKAMELDIQSYDGLMFNERYNITVQSAAEFTPVVRNAVSEQVGSEIVGINSVNSIVDTAIKKGHEALVTPVILTTNDERFAVTLNKDLKRLTTSVFLVAAGKVSKTFKKDTGCLSVSNVTEDSVGETLVEIRAKVLS
ncbi:MAG TPA: hypothetical protein VIJ14_09860 [Rhabdochlamydiaceae bacterium]